MYTNTQTFSCERPLKSVSQNVGCFCCAQKGETCLQIASYSHFHNDRFFLSKNRKYSGTQRCRKISNRCISVTGSNVEFFFQAKKKTIIMKMRVRG